MNPAPLIQQYLDQITKRYKAGNSTEHTFRGDLQTLLEALLPGALVTNEPMRIACGAPDYIVTRNDIPVCYLEAKDLGANLKSKAYKEQFDRYRAALPHLIITDYLTFEFYREGEPVATVQLAELANGKVNYKPENTATFLHLVKEFASYGGQTIKSSRRLAELMAAKARMLAQVIESALTSDEENQENSSLQDQMQAFQQILIHDIRAREFSDIYAQTIAYGMFAARLHDHTLPTFTRQEAANLIPKTNPFLRKLFQYIAGYDLDSRIVWIVDGLADLFRATDVKALLQNFGKSTQTHDPIIHFYETFLAEYDPKLRKARGVWYTPEPVVNFIVRAVDDILKTEFNLPQGLADTSKTTIKTKTVTKATADQRSKPKEVTVEQEIHKVQILDPATGTGTFLAEVVKHIYQGFATQKGIWPAYVENHLIPRLNGFELLMASYAMAHLKLDMLLTETGYAPSLRGRGGEGQQRFRIYLTNSLEEHHPETGTLFANWLSTEANEANQIKRDTPVMVVLGNPPYSGESANKGDWIMGLMEDYKKEPGGKEKLKEKNPKWINDDYVKFLRYGQHFIEKNGEGILAFINPHGFLDNPTFRGMRWNLLKTYDKIYTLDLHGNSKKKETAPDGSPDVNVFDIQQGVSINFFIKTGKKKANELGKVFHFDLFGKRDEKYDFLLKNSIKSVAYKQLENSAPNYYFVNKNFDEFKIYNEGFSINELFIISSVSIATSRDGFVISIDKPELINKIKVFCDLTKTDPEIYSVLNLKDNRDWKLPIKRKLIIEDKDRLNKLTVVDYRVFDTRYIFYHKDAIDFGRESVMKHMAFDNLALITNRQFRTENFHHVFISKNITDLHVMETANACPNHFPLYLYPDKSAQISLSPQEGRKPNLNPEIVQQLAAGLGLSFVPEKEDAAGNVCFAHSAEVRPEYRSTFAPIDLLDYIYAVLHSPAYRAKYKEFLKIDFPRVPYPTNPATFWQLVALGGQLRQLHLLQSPALNQPITQYPEPGSNLVEKIRYEGYIYDHTDPDENGEFHYPDYLGAVYINDTQYFADVPTSAWEFYIGGYQPAQKWLKDRRGRTLSFDDIRHYQQIIVALKETARLMEEIDKLELEWLD